MMIALRREDANAMPSPIVAVLTFDHFSPFHCAVPCLIFGDILPGQPLFELRLCCGDASIHSHSTQGFTIQAPYVSTPTEN